MNQPIMLSRKINQTSLLHSLFDDIYFTGVLKTEEESHQSTLPMAREEKVQWALERGWDQQTGKCSFMISIVGTQILPNSYYLMAPIYKAPFTR
jgi:hypothetical protein